MTTDSAQHRRDSVDFGSQIGRRLLARQIEAFCRSSDAAMAAGMAAAMGVGWILWLDHSLAVIASWYLALTIVSIGRAWAQRRIRAKLDELDLPRTEKRLLAGLIVFGAIWSVPGVLTLTDPSRQVALGAFLAGIAAAGVWSASPLRYGYASFLLPFMLPVAVHYLIEPPVMLGIGTLLYVTVMLGFAKRQHYSSVDTLRTHLENEALTERVQQEKEIVERANRDLQEQIAQRERTEAELRVAKSEAETANRAKSQFLANMSHELRTPLNGVLGMSELLQRTPLNPKQQKYVQTVHQSGQRVLHIVSDILDMARADTGRLQFESIEFEPRRVVAEIAEQFVDAARDKGLALTTSIDAFVPKRLRGDPHRLRQILSNLLDNAVKFTEHGKIMLGVAPAPETDANRNPGKLRLRWSVADSGIGIDADACTRLFQPFSQVDNSSTRRFGGIGLGLAICRQLIQAQGGSIDVESSPGKGSAFWFELSFERTIDTAATQPIAINRLAAPEKLDARVLVAEDNLANRQLAVEMLEFLGCRALVANNGIEALAALEHEQVDAVLMDWHMPEMDGLAATRELRSREHLGRAAQRHVPVIALTASVLPGDREACAQAGMDDFLAKPFTADQLYNALRRWLPKVY